MEFFYLGQVSGYVTAAASAILTAMAKDVCSACATALTGPNEGIELWGSRFCAGCFVTQSADLHREMKPEDLAVLRRMGRDLAGLLPPHLIQMILTGFHQRSAGKPQPPAEELERAIGEIQRLTAFAVARRIINLLTTWQAMFNEFAEGQQREMQEQLKRLADLDA
jgi:hypothetical protein